MAGLAGGRKGGGIMLIFLSAMTGRGDTWISYGYAYGYQMDNIWLSYGC